NRPTRNLQHFATTNEGAVDHKNIPSVKITNEFDGNSEDGSHFTQDHSSWSSFFEDDAKYPLYQRRRRRNSISNHSVATNSNSMKGHFTPFDPSHTNLEGDKFADDRRGSTGAPRPIRRTRATAQVSVRVPSGTATRRPRRSPPEGVDNADDSSAWRSPCSSVVDRRRPSTAPLRGRPSRKKFDPVCRADPVTLWRLYSTEWSKHSRAVEMSERSLRWSVKEAMMVKEVPVLPSSARSVSHFGHHRPFNPGDGNFVGRRSASSYLMY
uniref:DUF4005 domain-containing protein n=2 Tax=Mesocestoides corti TaxID=53468 RepID=A0A5K3FWH0_MESCO